MSDKVPKKDYSSDNASKVSIETVVVKKQNNTPVSSSSATEGSSSETASADVKIAPNVSDTFRTAVGNLRNQARKKPLNRKISTASLWSSTSASSVPTDASLTSKSNQSSAPSLPYHYGSDTASMYSAPDVGDSKNRMLLHAKKGEWSSVETIIRYIRRGEPELFCIDDETGINPFMLACRDNKLVIVERLIELGVNVNDRTRDNRNALHFAAASAKEDVVNCLLKKRADPTILGGPKEQNALHVACARTGSDSRSVVQALLKHMRPEIRFDQRDRDGVIPLFYCVEAGNQGACKDILSSYAEKQLKYQLPTSKECALHIACRKRDLDIVRLLCENQSPVNIKNVRRFLQTLNESPRTSLSAIPTSTVFASMVSART